MLRRFVCHTKNDPLVDEVHLMDINPSYAHIRYPDGCESTVSIKDLSACSAPPIAVVRDTTSPLSHMNNEYLIFHDHISGICKSTHFHLRGIGRIRNLLTFDATAQLIHALITSRLDFCNSILYNLPNKQIERLQRIQNQAARILKHIPRRNHITPVLRELHWLIKNS